MNVKDFTVADDRGKDVALGDYQGKVLLIVNTATECGLTPQYEGLEKLYEQYKDKGFEILDFPCNQFMGQAPGTADEINSFCTSNYGTTFKRFAKVDVNGPTAAPLFKALREALPSAEENEESLQFLEVVKPLRELCDETDIRWNFGKFLIDKDGNAVRRFGPGITPDKIAPAIDELL
ncbi:MAG: glutathione peroxidase [Coriobacteriales bacterium]|jgi:glutathione peroxidase|nr:glutathione peroxidase [Coriobacteriales bacterium]